MFTSPRGKEESVTWDSVLRNPLQPEFEFRVSGQY